MEPSELGPRARTSSTVRKKEEGEKETSSVPFRTRRVKEGKTLRPIRRGEPSDSGRIPLSVVKPRPGSKVESYCDACLGCRFKHAIVRWRKALATDDHILLLFLRGCMGGSKRTGVSPLRWLYDSPLVELSPCAPDDGCLA